MNLSQLAESDERREEAQLRVRHHAALIAATEIQSSAIIVHEAKRTATSTRTTETRQNNPYPLGATTFSPWTHTSDDSYIYQLSLVLATAAVSLFIIYSCLCQIYHLCCIVHKNKNKKPILRTTPRLEAPLPPFFSLLGIS